MKKAQREKKKPGRPEKPGPKRRNTVTIRMNDQLKARTLKQAEQNGRSLSEEIEHELEASRQNAARADDIRKVVRQEIVESFGGSDWFRIMNFLSAILRRFEEINGTSMRDDPATCQMIAETADAFFREFGPKGEIPPPGAVLKRILPNETIKDIMKSVSKQGKRR